MQLTDEQIEKFLAAKSSVMNGTWRDAFAELLKMLFKEVECFDSKKPFGYSDWYDSFLMGIQSANPELKFFTLDDEGNAEYQLIGYKEADQLFVQIINRLTA